MATCDLCGIHCKNEERVDEHIDTVHVPDKLVAEYVRKFPAMSGALVKACARAHVFTTDHAKRRCVCYREAQP